MVEPRRRRRRMRRAARGGGEEAVVPAQRAARRDPGGRGPGHDAECTFQRSREAMFMGWHTGRRRAILSANFRNFYIFAGPSHLFRI